MSCDVSWRPLAKANTIAAAVASIFLGRPINSSEQCSPKQKSGGMPGAKTEPKC